MTPTLADIEAALDREGNTATPMATASDLLRAGEMVLEHWIEASGDTPTQASKEGFRLLALHRQGARGSPSFNACRETCRELAYHYNLISSEPDHPATRQRLIMMRLVARHLLLFITGKMQVAGLGEFCCAAKPLRAAGE